MPIGKVIDPRVFGRRLVATAKQFFAQRLRDVERNYIYEDYGNRIGEIIIGVVHQTQRDGVYVNIEQAELRMPKSEQIKTERYRLIRWTYDNEIHHELYDHKFDKLENINLVKNTAYQDTLDFLKLTLNKRIEEARKKPNGLGRQFENAKPTFEPIRIKSVKKSISN